MTESDIAVAEKLGKYIGYAGSAGELIIASVEVLDGGWGASELTASGVGSFVEPEGTVGAALLMFLAGGTLNSADGSGVGMWLLDE